MGTSKEDFGRSAGNGGILLASQLLSTGLPCHPIFATAGNLEVGAVLLVLEQRRTSRPVACPILVLLSGSHRLYVAGHQDSSLVLIAVPP